MNKIFIIAIMIMNQWVLFFGNFLAYKIDTENKLALNSLIVTRNSAIAKQINANHPAFYNEDMHNNFTDPTKISEYAFKELKIVLESIDKSSYYKQMKFRGYLPKLDQKKVEIYVAFDDNETHTIEFHYYNATRKKITEAIAKKTKKISIKEKSKKELWNARLYVEGKANGYKSKYISNYVGKTISVNLETIYISLSRVKFKDWKVNKVNEEKTNVDIYYEYFPTEDKFKLQVNLKKDKDDDDDDDKDDNDTDNNQDSNDFSNDFTSTGGFGNIFSWLGGLLGGLAVVIKESIDEFEDFIKNIFDKDNDSSKEEIEEIFGEGSYEEFLSILEIIKNDKEALEKWLAQAEIMMDILGPYERVVIFIIKLPGLTAQKITINFDDKWPSEDSIKQLKNYLTSIFKDLVISKQAIKKTDDSVDTDKVKKILDLTINNEVLWNNEMVPFNHKRYLKIKEAVIKNDMLNLTLKYRWIAEPIELKINLI